MRRLHFADVVAYAGAVMGSGACAALLCSVGFCCGKAETPHVVTIVALAPPTALKHTPRTVLERSQQKRWQKRCLFSRATPFRLRADWMRVQAGILRQTTLPSHRNPLLLSPGQWLFRRPQACPPPPAPRSVRRCSAPRRRPSGRPPACRWSSSAGRPRRRTSKVRCPLCAAVDAA